MANSLFNVILQFSTDGSSSLKVYLFLSFQMHQLIVMIIPIW
jgi:hypothetical protein